MVEADIHLWPLHTSIVDINKVFQLLVWCLKGIWVHPYIVTLTKLAPDLGSQGYSCAAKMMPQCHGWVWYPPQTTSYMHNRHIQSFEPLVCCLKGIWLNPYIITLAKLPPDLGIQVQWRRSGNDATMSWMRLIFHTPILDLCKVFESLVCCLKGIWLHPYTVTPAKLPLDLGIQVHLRSGNVVSRLDMYHTNVLMYYTLGFLVHLTMI
jgi:hypothetical protein